MKIKKITKDYLERMQIKHPMVKLTFDVMLKSFFNRNEKAYKRFISTVAHLNLEPNEMNITDKNTELPVFNFKEYNKRVDFYTDINGNILLNLELNNSYFEDVKLRNKIYHSKKMSLNLKKGAKGKDIKKLSEIDNIQLNLNVKDKSKTLGEDIVVPYSIVTNTIYVNNDKTYIRYLDYYRNLYYNGNVELEESDYWLALLTAENYVELNEMRSKFVSDDFREEIVRDVITLSNDESIFDIYDSINGDILVEAQIEKRRKRELEEREEKIKEQDKEIKDKDKEIKDKDKEIKDKDKEIKEKEEKIKTLEKSITEKDSIIKNTDNKKIEIARNLLNENVSIDIISKATGLSLEEIKNIQ